MTNDTLTEDLSDWSSALTIDTASRMVRNVALTGTDSRNGYRYSESALREAVALYDQKPVFLDHAPDRMKPRDRSARDLVGNIINPRYEDQRIRGDIRVLDTESGRTFLALAHSNLPGVGMSHVVLAQRSSDGSLVESIRDVVCVDAVINPATTYTFRESTTSLETDSSLPASDALDSLTVVPSLHERLLASQVECERLHKQLLSWESRALLAEKQAELHKLLCDSNLPQSAITSTFLHQLEQAPTTELRHEILRDRQQLCEQARTHSPVSRERIVGSTRPSAMSDSHFASVIRQRYT